MAKVAHLKGPEKEGKRDSGYSAVQVEVDKLGNSLGIQAEATTLQAGLMSAADKVKLDNIVTDLNIATDSEVKEILDEYFKLDT